MLVWLSAPKNFSAWAENALEAGTQIRQHNNIQMVSLHDHDTAFAIPASPVLCP